MSTARGRGQGRPLAAICRPLVLSILVLATGWTSATPADLDPLHRPSVASARAASALMTAVTPAGQRLVAVGERGIVVTSDDGGARWTQRLTPVSVMLTAVRFATDRKGWAVGHSGVVLMTDDGGATWTRQLDGMSAAQAVLAAARQRVSTRDDDAAKKALADAKRLVADGADKPFLDLLVDSESTVTVVGAYGLALRSTDGGKSWADWQPRIPNAKGNHLYAIRRAGQCIILAGEQSVVFRSTDDGETFAQVPTPYAGSYFGAVMASPQRFVVFGLQGNAYATTDGGATWTRSRTGTSAPLSGGVLLRDGSFVIVSQAGQVLRSADGGVIFAALDVKAPVPFIGAAQAKDGQLVLAGARGMTGLALSAQGSKP